LSRPFSRDNPNVASYAYDLVGSNTIISFLQLRTGLTKCGDLRLVAVSAFQGYVSEFWPDLQASL